MSEAETALIGGTGITPALLSRAAEIKVVVGMSGGVDSSVASLLLKRAGFQVVGLFMNNWEEEDGGVCTAAQDFGDVVAVCGKIGVPYYSVNFSKNYMEDVFSVFLSELKAGRTPNPDVLCNREIKFKQFVHYAALLGADYVATGHYCGIGHDGPAKLLTARDESKDQTYFLNQVTTEQLKGVLFPLAGMEKAAVRALAEAAGLATSRKKDSTGICFIGERNFKSFLRTYLPALPGEIKDTAGRTVGRHDGLMYYTLGQRRGLGIGGVAGEGEGRWYVVEKDLKENVLYVSRGEGEELLSSRLKGEGMNVIGDFDVSRPFLCGVKVRYRQPCQAAKAEISSDGSLTLTFEKPQRAVTEGQYAVLYLKGRCLGGAVITEVLDKGGRVK